ncbi:MAG TPA: hypothetical protein PKX05_04740, partial [bacterium]|nr:hypothetical protein [bacterium]
MNIKNTLINLVFFAVCGFFLFVTDVSYSASQSGYLFYVKGNNLWVYDLSNQTSNQITHLETSIGSGTIANPSISGDGSRIVFSYKTDNTSSETILYSVGY